jgi:multidrug efflux pump subunit AcrA (membrane-fusion protein)
LIPKYFQRIHLGVLFILSFSSIDDLKQQLQRAQTERTRMAAVAQTAQSAHSQASTQLQIHQSQLTFCKQEIASLKAAVAERDALLSRERQQRGDAAEALASTQRLVEHERSLIESLKREHEQVISDMKSQQWLKVQNEVALYEEKARLDLAALKFVVLSLLCWCFCSCLILNRDFLSRARHHEETELLLQKLQSEKRISVQYSENVSEFEQRFRELGLYSDSVMLPTSHWFISWLFSEMSQREKEAAMALQQSQQQQHFAETLATREKQYLTSIGIFFIFT